MASANFPGWTEKSFCFHSTLKTEPGTPVFIWNSPEPPEEVPHSPPSSGQIKNDIIIRVTSFNLLVTKFGSFTVWRLNSPTVSHNHTMRNQITAGGCDIYMFIITINYLKTTFKNVQCLFRSLNVTFYMQWHSEASLTTARKAACWQDLGHFLRRPKSETNVLIRCVVKVTFCDTWLSAVWNIICKIQFEMNAINKTWVSKFSLGKKLNLKKYQTEQMQVHLFHTLSTFASKCIVWWSFLKLRFFHISIFELVLCLQECWNKFLSIKKIRKTNKTTNWLI